MLDVESEAMTQLKCACVDWIENIDRLNFATMLAYTHGMEYEGKVFVYCPWCSAELQADAVKQECQRTEKET